ncbi:MFS transporter [Leuconostoc rapi]|uniref:MFS transporter n=1 Tax=Leuconostoc rapi TaxID=1406906 RepID=UPI00195A0832|nr:MFS transporter [Leuconostoc rapi]MBM7436297.1 EmrB/QacA subfamily drug resistance transporter [Leuconostoc rapi]
MDKKVSPVLLLAILAIGIQGFVDIFLGTALNVSFHNIANDFHKNLSTVQWLSSGVMITATITTLMGPWLTQRITIKQQFFIISIISMIGVILDAVATQFGLILIGRLFQGLGGGLGITLMFSVIFQQVPLAKRGAMMGLGGLLISFAPVLGPALSGWLNDHWSWHAVFWLVLPLQVIALIVGSLTIKQVVSTTRPFFDARGWFILVVFFITGLVGIERLISSGVTLYNIIFIVLFSLSGGFYYWHQRVIKTPIINIDVFRQNIFTLGFIAAFGAQLVLLTYIATTPLLIQTLTERTATFSGLIVLPGAIGNAVMSYIGGILYDRFGMQLPIMIGTFLLLTGTVMGLLFNTTLWTIVLSITLYQFGAGFWFSTNMTESVSRLPENLQSTGNALFNIGNNYAAAIGTALAIGMLNVVNVNNIYYLNVLRLVLIVITSILVFASMRLQRQN